MLHLLHSDKINEGKQVTLGIRRIISHGSTGNVRISGMNFTMLEKKYASSKTPENKILLNTRAKEYRLVLNANYTKIHRKMFRRITIVIQNKHKSTLENSTPIF